MPTVSYSEALRHARLAQITAELGSGALLRIYDGVRPAAGGTPTTLLAELATADPFAPAPTDNTLTAGAIEDGIAVESGDASWFRLVTAGGDFVVDGDAGEASDSPTPTLVLEERTVVEGGIVSVDSLVVTGGNVA